MAGEVSDTDGGILEPGLGVGVGDGLGVGVGMGLPPLKYKPLRTAVLAPVRVTVIFTRPRMSQTRYCPPLKAEIALLSSKALVAQSKTSIRCDRLFPSQSK